MQRFHVETKLCITYLKVSFVVVIVLCWLRLRKSHATHHTPLSYHVANEVCTISDHTITTDVRLDLILPIHL